MTEVIYKVITPKGNTETKSLARAQEIVAEKGGRYETTYREIPKPAPVLSEAREAYLKSGKPLPKPTFSAYA